MIRALRFRPRSSASAIRLTGSSGWSTWSGHRFAKEIFYTARQFDAEEAYAMGLVNRVLPEAELESYVKSITDMIAVTRR